MSADRLVGPDPAEDESSVEVTLRPQRLGDFVGQERIRRQLDLVLGGARRRGPGSRRRQASCSKRLFLSTASCCCFCSPQ